jgi:predicted nuclease of predicted toxin-antitoxin system
VSFPLYMDVHVPYAITRALRQRGVNVLTAQEDGTTEWDDPPLLDRATELGRLLFTRDEDLLVEAARRQRRGREFSTVVFAHQLRVTIGGCVADLELIARSLRPDEAKNRVVHLPL